ncbi:MAG: tyrosine-type recombinase/integrase [Planctomycetota bacterium]|nr:tyrosine-type recombinase/integrase [Planctomycetota bacterium]
MKGRVYCDNYVIIARDEEGNQVRIPLHTKVYEDAKEKLREWQAARNAGDNSAITGRRTVIEYNNLWLAGKELDAVDRGVVRPQTIVKYRNYITPFNKYLVESGNEFLQMKDLKDTHLKGYQAWRRKQTRFGKPGGVPISPEGINREVKFLNSVFKHAYSDHLIPKDPTKGVENLKTTPKKILLPGATELLAVFQATGDQVVMDYATIIAITGMRAMEGMSRKFKHVDIELRILHICDDGDFKLKNANSARDIPLPDEARAIIARIRAERKNAMDEDYVFVKPDGSPLMEHKDHAYHVVTRTLRALNRKRRKAGIREIPDFNIRTLRHWFISWALNRPVNALTETQLIKIVGHADFEMIRNTYYHLDVEGESGRKMRETPLFSGMADAGTPPVADAVAAFSPAADPRNDKDVAPPAGGARIMLGFSLRRA